MEETTQTELQTFVVNNGTLSYVAYREENGKELILKGEQSVDFQSFELNEENIDSLLQALEKAKDQD